MEPVPFRRNLPMDAHSFRILASHLTPLLAGARIDKIYGPLPNLTVFHCFGVIGKFFFAVQTHKQHPRYFIQHSPLPNPPTPTAEVMRLRKYLINAHFGEAVSEMSSRTLALPIMRRGETVNWLICSPARGVLLCDELPAGFPSPIVWPDDDLLDKLHEPGQLEDPATWFAYPILTPLLRKTLAVLDKPEAMALMVDLEAGGDTLFFYGSDNNQPTSYSAWPLPDALCREANIVPIETNPQEPGYPLRTDSEQADASGIPHDLALASFIDEQQLHAAFSAYLHKDGKQDTKREQKRLRRKERALEQEALRLQSMVERQKDARLIQENLWRLDPEAKYDNITLTSTLPSGKTATRTIALDPSLNIRDNMLDIFKKAEKGKRGLAILSARRQHIPGGSDSAGAPPADNLLEILPQGGRLTEKAAAILEGPADGLSGKIQEKHSARPATPGQQPSSLTGWHNLHEQPGRYTQKNVAVFRSSDGYTILRGKNAQGNRQILKLAKPHDMWLHVHDGPSAHAIIKRDHAKDEVPNTTITEAARLVAEKSWQKENDSAEIMLALVKNVQSIKGAAAGTVKVDKLLRTVYIKRVSV